MAWRTELVRESEPSRLSGGTGLLPEAITDHRVESPPAI